MVSVVTKKIPSVVLVDEKELDRGDLFRLNKLYNTDLSEFVLCEHKRDMIYVNKSLEYAKDIVPIINKVMEQKYLNSRMEKLLDMFSESAGGKACKTLFAIWRDWQKERRKADARTQAEEIMKRVRKKHIRSHVKPNKDIIKAVFYLGFGLYEEDAKCDYDKGAEYVFMYGYLCGLEKGESHERNDN